MSSAGLPERPRGDQLRRQAKELRAAALAGDQPALARLHPYLPAGESVMLAVAQLAVAREPQRRWLGYVTRWRRRLPRPVVIRTRSRRSTGR